MKKNIKNVVALLFLPVFGIITKFNATNAAVQNNGEKSAVLQSNYEKYGGLSNVTNSISEETVLKNSVTKKQITYSIDSVYSDDLKNNPFKYSTVRKEITFLSKQKKTLATVVFEINFRFNSITEEAKCLSTSLFQYCVSKDCCLKAFSQAENKTTEHGRGYTTVSFEQDGVKDNVRHEFECGYNGEITGREI